MNSILLVDEIIECIYQQSTQHGKIKLSALSVKHNNIIKLLHKLNKTIFNCVIDKIYTTPIYHDNYNLYIINMDNNQITCVSRLFEKTIIENDDLPDTERQRGVENGIIVEEDGSFKHIQFVPCVKTILMDARSHKSFHCAGNKLFTINQKYHDYPHLECYDLNSNNNKLEYNYSVQLPGTVYSHIICNNDPLYIKYYIGNYKSTMIKIDSIKGLIVNEFIIDANYETAVVDDQVLLYKYQGNEIFLLHQALFTYESIYKLPDDYHICYWFSIKQLKLPYTVFVLVHDYYDEEYIRDDDLPIIIDPLKTNYKPACMIILLNSKWEVIYEEPIYTHYAIDYFVVGNTVFIVCNNDILAYNFDNLS